MPRIAGIELLRLIRNTSDFASTTVYIYTGSEDPRHRVQAVELNVDGYLLKDEMQSLFATIRDKIEQS